MREITSGRPRVVNSSSSLRRLASPSAVRWVGAAAMPGGNAERRRARVVGSYLGSGRRRGVLSREETGFSAAALRAAVVRAAATAVRAAAARALRAAPRAGGTSSGPSGRTVTCVDFAAALPAFSSWSGAVRPWARGARVGVTSCAYGTVPAALTKLSSRASSQSSPSSVGDHQMRARLRSRSVLSQ